MSNNRRAPEESAQHLARLGADEIGLSLVGQASNNFRRILQRVRMGPEKIITAGTREVQAGLVALSLEDVGEQLRVC